MMARLLSVVTTVSMGILTSLLILFSWLFISSFCFIGLWCLMLVVLRSVWIIGNVLVNRLIV